ncbi:UDP-glucose 4-epimerase GalE [Conexibacter sp. DBS9H8]|uniref:UDP-glucose 4-epimerase GalE n=1 Tax=Conexibacter sp. DBS9H8 TaxID=2937801 RepID=UPI00200F6297|nr:UDP-glucose 4-epimerase GalE [Conexibacter sp. DBS9H8]
MRLLLTGGAGYVGSIVSRHLLGAGHELTVLDNLSTGHRAAVAPGAAFVELDLRDGAAVHAALAGGYDGVLHFAALSLVGESMSAPGRYWENNVLGSLHLLEAIVAHGIPRLVFSSTAATYGVPETVPIREDAPTRPSNPYGASKLAVDLMIGGFCTAHGLGAVSLRYFNVAGAHAAGHIGEAHDPETHLIPNVLKVPLGERDAVSVFGSDYPTPDGTAVRDYIHINDLAAAHVLALHGARAGEHRIFNLGTGSGFSVREVIAAAEQVTGQAIPTREAPRRPGDPPALIASSERIADELGWVPAKPSLEAMIADAWAFAQAHPHGYPAGG